MKVECGAIIVLILVMSLMILRTGRSGQAVAVLPLITVPLFHVLGRPLSGLLHSWFPSLSARLFYVSIDLVALVVACVLFGLLAGNMVTRRGRRFYMILCGGFSALLAIRLVNFLLPL